MRYRSIVGMLCVILAQAISLGCGPYRDELTTGSATSAIQDPCYEEWVTCTTTTSECSNTDSCPWCDDAYAMCLLGPSPSPFVDTCTSCSRPSAGDQDHDAIPDALEYDLAYRFFPNLELQGYDYDLAVSYAYLGYTIPYTVQPYAGGMCDDDHECLEIRYGIDYTRDFGDNEGYINFFGGHGHPGDSEFYSLLVQRTAPWSTAAANSSAWQLIRDFTAAHWGTLTDSSRMVSYGYCPPECSFLGETACTSHSQCSWFRGLCTGGVTQRGVVCSQQFDAESCQFSGCRWLAPTCMNRGEVHCYSNSPLSTHNDLYASERKHGLYHSVKECNAGAWTADQCPSNAYNLWNYISGKLQNVGGPKPEDHSDFDTDMQAPDRISRYRFWDDSSFGDSTPYKKHFTTAMNWNLPAPWDTGSGSTGCGEASCTSVQGTYVSHFSGPGCTGTESYYLPYDGYAYSCRTWNGTGQCGTTRRTVTNYSARINGGPCQDLWPSGNTLSDFVTVYRGGASLSVGQAGSGTGTVTSSPAGISCGATCSAMFAPGTVVTLAAGAAAGSTFVGWTGGGCSGTGSCTVTLSAAQSVSAVFSATVASGCGEASCVPAQGMHISHFSGPGCTGTESYYLPYEDYTYTCRTWDGTGQCGTTRHTVTSYSARINGGPCQDLWPSGNTLSEFVTVYRGAGSTTAYILSVSREGTGIGTVTSSPAGIACGATCSASFAAGTAVTLTASAAAGSTFAGWIGGGCSGTGSCTVTLSAAQSVSAVFNATGSNCGEASCVPAQAMYVSHFSGPGCTGTESYYLPYDNFDYACRTWDGTGQCGTIHRTVTTYSVRINGGPCQDLWPSGNTLSDFVTVYRGGPTAYTLSISRSGTGTGTVVSNPAGISCGATCSASFAAGAVVTLTASAASGSTFAGWSGGGCAGTGACTVTLSAAQSVSATFNTSSTGGGCGEASCVPAQAMYISHFSGPGCTGTESYYLPYDNFGYACRTWDGTGQCGTIHRTVTNYSARINGGPCQDLWPSGNTLSDFVTVYR